MSPDLRLPLPTRRAPGRTCTPAGLLGVCLLAVAAACASPPAESRPALDGRPVPLFPRAGERAVAWVFVSPDCPVANAYAPEIARIASQYGERGVRLIVVHADDTVARERLREHAAAHGLPDAVVVDEGHVLAARAGVRHTPEAVVFDAAGRLCYRGRIDDLFPELGVRRPEPTTRDLRDALDAVLVGREVERPRTEAVGCLIEGTDGA